MISIMAVGLINALGNNNQQIANNLHMQPGQNLVKQNWLVNQPDKPVAPVQGVLPKISGQFNTRNNQLLLAALQQIQPQVDQLIDQYGHKRLAIIMGSSTSGIHEGDLAVGHYLQHHQFPPDYHYQQQEPGDPALFLANYLHTNGPTYTISTACSSSSRAIISGQRLIKAGLVDAALVGGADSLCRLAINGFNSLESLSDSLCQPFARQRKGINIGEGAALLLLSRHKSDIALLGIGESSDAYHMSAPHPQGLGAEKAMRMALTHARLTPQDVGYINLHGTATQLNDKVEALAVNRVFGHTIPCSSTKQLTGHTLGAAGATEAGLAWLILQQNLRLPAQDFCYAERDNTLENINLVTEPIALDKPVICSNSFAFGGNNTAIILGRTQ